MNYSFDFAEDVYILPTVGGHCLSHPCYTLLEAFENATQIFTSNTTIIFPAGTFRVSVGKGIIIQDVNNPSLSKYTVIVCDTDIGLNVIHIY